MRYYTIWGTVILVHGLWIKINSKPLEEEYEKKEKICTNDFGNDT